jgi:hypothetical protein
MRQRWEKEIARLLSRGASIFRILLHPKCRRIRGSKSARASSPNADALGYMDVAAPRLGIDAATAFRSHFEIAVTRA